MSAIWNVESLPLSVLRSYGVVLCTHPPSVLWQRSEETLEIPQVWTGHFWQGTNTWGGKQDSRINPETHQEPSEWNLGLEEPKTTAVISWTPLRGCSFSLIWQQSWEIIWISLLSVACLSGFSADWVPSRMFLSVPYVCGCPVCVQLRLFVLPSCSFSACCLHVGLLFWDKRRACVCGWSRCTVTASGLDTSFKLRS